MILKQYYLGCLAHASYLVADEKTRAAVVVDPQRDIEQYLNDAAKLNFKIQHVFLTHFHADFVAGHLELRDRVGATIHLGARAEADYPFAPAADGDILRLGNLKLEILQTPGHTPEAISILVYDMTKDPLKPHAVLTGDTLFIGDVGRPDLMASVGISATELAGMLYDSLHDKLLPLPDETLVYPAHGAGSMCGKNLSQETVSTIGVQRRHNYALQPMAKEAFIRIVTADLPEAPAYFAHDAMLNRRERATLDKTLGRALKPLALDDLVRMKKAGAQVLDVREPADFAGAHMADSINIGLSGKFATWAGALLSPERLILLIAEPGREQEAAMRLGRIGFDHMAGYLDRSMQALGGRPSLIKKIDRVTAVTVAELLAAPDPPLVLDVRTPGEWSGKRIEGSLNIPLNKLEARIGEIPRDRKLVVHCASGYRSSMAVSLLERRGFTGFSDMVGGFAAWEAASLTVATSSAGS
ncbi:MAG TPA: MBL fold metallo-hydrolase [Candidatus Polarisedimenticolia bacterium]|jgi:glyoxylase-like metal-dependent hydrolase (beta-lactamase superfamily II)/rhodanese-related sulfurtransferase